MNKIKQFLSFVLIGLALSLSANAQENVIPPFGLGIRACPDGIGVNARYYFNDKINVEGQINSSGGTRGGSGKSIMYGILLQYNLMIAGPDLRFFMGGGFHAGMWQKDKDRGQYLGTNGLDGVAGIEYTFARIPFSISVDVKPSLNYISGVTYFPNNNLGFGIRYVFGGWASVPDPKDSRE